MSGVCSFSFGGSAVLTNHFFAANGNASSSTSATDVGNAFVLPIAMRIVAFSWHKANENPGFVTLTSVSVNPLQLYVDSSFGSKAISSEWLRVAANSVIRLQATNTNGNTAFRSCLITIYFTLEGNDWIGRSLNVVPFAGNIALKSPYVLKFGVDARTLLDTNMNYIGTMFTVPTPMRLFRVGYQKAGPDLVQDPTLQFYKNGQRVVNGSCTLGGVRGVVNFPLPDDSPARQLSEGDVLQLRYEPHARELSTPGICIVTLYTTEEGV